MPVATYYFDASDNGPTDNDAAWTNDANAFDGSTTTFASASAGGSLPDVNVLGGGGTNAPSIGGTISQVRARIYATNGLGPVARATIYTDALAQSLGSIDSTAAGLGTGWGDFTTLSTPTGGWDWSILQALEALIYTDTNNNVYRVEVEVTYTDPPITPTVAWLRA